MKTTLGEIVLEQKIFEYRPDQKVFWSSGIHSPFYMDNRLLLSDVDSRKLVSSLLRDKIKSKKLAFNKICAVATAGIPWGMLIAHEWEVPFIYVRPENKKHGKKNKVEGKVYNNDQILVIEDLISTGRSASETVLSLRELGARCENVVSIFNYHLKSSQKLFDEQDISFYSLLTLNDIFKLTKGDLFQDDEILSFQRSH